MALPALVDGALPIGRFPATLAEVSAMWVDDPQFAGSATRRAIWAEFLLGTSALKRVVKLHAMWIGGSFTTAKLDPGDIDVVYLVNAEDRYSRPPRDRMIVDVFATPVQDQETGKITRLHNLAIDSFVVDWAPHLGDPGLDSRYGGYVSDRGYWDDFWQRQRVGPESQPPTRESAFPTRGYVEVSVDGYC